MSDRRLPIGAELPSLTKTIAQRQIDCYSGVRPHSIHTDPEWARKKGAGLASAELLPGARLVRAFNAIGAYRMGEAHKEPGRIGMPVASDDAGAIEIASHLIRDIGYEPVPIGGLAMGRHLMPGTQLAGEHAPAEVRRIAATLK